MQDPVKEEEEMQIPTYVENNSVKEEEVKIPLYGETLQEETEEV